jgi:transcriptional regulator with XRE-family HTH domain
VALQALRPNRRLRLQRRLRGWSQEDVAVGLCRVANSVGESDIGVDSTMVSRWERGTRRPRPRYVRLLCQLFDLPAEQLGLVEDSEMGLVSPLPADGIEGDETVRRDFLQGAAALLGLAHLSPFLRPSAPGIQPARPEAWERLEHALRRPGLVDEETVQHLERTTQALEGLEPTALSARALVGPATGHLDAIATLLRTSLPSGIRVRLCSLAGETAALVGWLRCNLDDREGGAACFRTGLQAAREADDRALGAYLVGCAALRPPRPEDPAVTLAHLTGSSSGFSQRAATPGTRAWLAAKEADAWAKLGRRDQCMRALDRAAEIIERLPDADPLARPRVKVVGRSWLEGERGAALARLGRVHEAHAILRPVVASLGPTSESDRLWLLTALASAHVGLGEPEEACRLARLALIGATRRHMAPVVQAVAAVRQRLDRHRRNLAVQELDDQIRTLAPRAAELAMPR